MRKKNAPGCVCCEPAEMVCWHRYSNLADSDLFAIAPDPLGGPVEDGDNPGQYHPSFWSDRTPGPSTPHDGTKIRVTGDNARIVNLVTVNGQLMRLEVNFSSIHSGSFLRIFFNIIGDADYCY